jgi:hypothetical protein
MNAAFVAYFKITYHQLLEGTGIYHTNIPSPNHYIAEFTTSVCVTHCTSLGTAWFSSIPPDKYQGNTLNSSRAYSFSIDSICCSPPFNQSISHLALYSLSFCQFQYKEIKHPDKNSRGKNSEGIRFKFHLFISTHSIKISYSNFLNSLYSTKQKDSVSLKYQSLPMDTSLTYFLQPAL